MNEEAKEEILEAVRLDRRRNNNFQQWGMVIALAVQFATFVWQASKMSATVEAQQIWQMEFRNNMTSLTTTVASLATQVAVNTNNVTTLTRAAEAKK